MDSTAPMHDFEQLNHARRRLLATAIDRQQDQHSEPQFRRNEAATTSKHNAAEPKMETHHQLLTIREEYSQTLATKAEMVERRAGTTARPTDRRPPATCRARSRAGRATWTRR